MSGVLTLNTSGANIRAVPALVTSNQTFPDVSCIDKSKTYLVRMDKNTPVRKMQDYMDYLEEKGIDAVIVPYGIEFYEAKNVDDLKAALKVWIDNQ